jgi:hypothetical protein
MNKFVRFFQNFMLKLQCYYLYCINNKGNYITAVCHIYNFILKLLFFPGRNSMVKDVCTHVGTENNIPAWIVLYCLSTQMDFKNPMFAVEYYRQTVTSNEVSTGSK